MESNAARKEPHLFRRLGHYAPGALPLQTVHEVSEFLNLEADLLDSWQFTEWLSMFAPDVHYWAPVRENRQMKEMDDEMYPPGTAAHFDETLEMLGQRVRRVLSTRAWAESPPSRTRHLVTNVRVFPAGAPSDDTYNVESSFLVYRSNGERYQDQVVGKRFDVIRRTASKYNFQIAKRAVVFDMATLLVKNLSLFY
jgi:3-phenylpropionate/cinnamic acid dioxygenase small subunit